MSPDSPPEPPAVVAARAGVRSYNLRVMWYVLALCAMTGVMVGVGEAFESGAFFWSSFAVLMGVTFGGIPFLREGQHRTDRNTIETWEARGLREEFAQFDRSAEVPVADDPRMEAAAGMAERIRALQASDSSTDAMVTRLEQRLSRLITDEAAARAAVTALGAVGAGGIGTERLDAAAQRLEEEIGGILTGMSDLYAALLEAESGAASNPTATLGEVMAWLSAEAEIARSAHGSEAMRPAREAAGPAPTRTGVTE